MIIPRFGGSQSFDWSNMLNRLYSGGSLNLGWGQGIPGSNGFGGVNPFPLGGGLDSMMYKQQQQQNQAFELSQRLQEEARARQAEYERQQMLTNEQNRQKTADFYGNQAKDLQLQDLMRQNSQNGWADQQQRLALDAFYRQMAQGPGQYTPDPLLEKQHQAAIAAANAQKNQMQEDLQKNVFGTGQEGTTMAGDKARQLGLNNAATYAGIEGDFAKLMMDDKYRWAQLNNPLNKFGMLSSLLGGMGRSGGGLDIGQLLGGMGGSGGLAGLLSGAQFPRYNAPAQTYQGGAQLGANVTAPPPPRQEVSDQFSGQSGGFGQGNSGLLQQLQSSNLSPEMVQKILQLLQGGGR